MKWMYIGCSQSYGTLHGMYNFGFCEGTEEDALEFARETAWYVCDSYSCITDPLWEDADHDEDVYNEFLHDELEYWVVRLRDDVDLDYIERLDWDYEEIEEKFGYKEL